MTAETKEHLLSSLFNTSEAHNLIATDFNNVVVREVGTEFMQGSKGLRIEFDISYHAIGKMGEAGSLIGRLADLCGAHGVAGHDNESA